MSGDVRTIEMASAEERLPRELVGQLRELGLTCSFWDASGGAALPPQAQNEFCRTLCLGGERPCAAAMARLAAEVCGEGRRKVETAPTGCLLLGAPVRQRRRLSGAVVCCMLTRQTSESEELARTCSRLQLDREHVARLARAAAGHDASEGPWLCQVLEWMTRHEQAGKFAHDELAKLSSNLSSTYEELSLLYRISGSMKVTGDATEFFEDLCRQLLEVMQIEAAAAVLYPRERTNQTDRVVWAGAMPLTADQLGRIARRYLAPRLSELSNAMIENDFAARASHLGPMVARIHSLVAVPLSGGERPRGILLGVNKRDGSFDSGDMKLLSSVGAQAAVFLENHHLYQDLQDLLMGMLHALTASIDAKDPYTSGHSQRVALVSRKLAELCGFEAKRAGRVYLAGLLHDIGKIGVPEAVLRKQGRLTEEEYDSVKRHPEISAKILSGVRQMEDLIPAIMHHHERFDGRGYPAKLAGQAIAIEARIVGLADSFDAMTSCRTYRAAMPLEAVMAEIRRCSGTQFDARLVELLLTLDLESFLARLRQPGSNQIQGEPT